jgi:RNA:NAD 2'-phosphotransferase (TPT1/KptA family)
VDFADASLRANAREIISGNLADDPSAYGVPPKPEEYDGMFEEAYHLSHEVVAAHDKNDSAAVVKIVEQAKALSNKFARALMQDHEGMGMADARFTVAHTPSPTRAPTTFFHGTAADVVDKILKDGLVPGSGSGGDAWAAEHGMHVQQYTFAGRDQSVYMSSDPEVAKAFARIAAKMHPGSKASVLKIEVPKDQVKDHLKYDELTRVGGGISSAGAQEKDAFRFVGKIDPSWISKLGDYDPNERGALSFAGDEEPDAKTIYAVILTDEDDGGGQAQDDFNPSEPRKPSGEGGGEWTSGSGGGGSSKLISPRNITAKRAGESTRGKYTIEHTPPPTLANRGETPGSRTFFHGTASEVVDKILKEGLVPGKSAGGDKWAAQHGMHVQNFTFAGRDQSVYMSGDLEGARAFARIAAQMHPGSKASVLKIVVPKDQAKDHLRYDEMTRSESSISSTAKQDPTAFRFVGNINPAWISKFNDYDPKERGALRFAGDEEPDAKTIYAVILTDEQPEDEMPVDQGGNPAMDEFNPSEARKPGGGEGGGEWTSGSGGGGSSKLVSPRNITAKRAGESTRGKYSPLDLAAMKEVPAVFDANVRLFKDGKFYPGMRPSEVKGNTDYVAQAVINRMKENIEFLVKLAPEDKRKEFAHWYEGAHKIAHELGQKYGVDDASAAGVIAALSPQQDWSQNVYFADQVLDIYHEQGQHQWDADIRDGLPWTVPPCVKERLDRPIFVRLPPNRSRNFAPCHPVRQVESVASHGDLLFPSALRAS